MLLKLHKVFKNIALISLLFMLNIVSSQHTIPDSIFEEAQIALAHFPQLNEVNIHFKFKKKIKKSIMQAQPRFKSLFRARQKREYVILISESFKISDTVYLTRNMPSEIMIGWLGHELGHVLDFESRSTLGLIGFGISYLFSTSYLKDAERRADQFAVNSGLEKHILATKNYILNHADLPEKYKNRIRKYYQSPDQILQMVNDRDSVDFKK